MSRQFVSILVCVISLGFSTVSGWAFDPEDATFDPEKQFVITPYGAILGDPAQFTTLGTDRVGFTFIQTLPDANAGMNVMLSLVEPQQNGKPGGGHSIMVTDTEADAFIALLRKGPEWAEIAKENAVGVYAKTIGQVTGEAGSTNDVRLVFVSDADNKGAIQLEQVQGTTEKKFLFSINAALKFANQTEAIISQARGVEIPATPQGDAEKDKLFE